LRKKFSMASLPLHLLGYCLPSPDPGADIEITLSTGETIKGMLLDYGTGWTKIRNYKTGEIEIVQSKNEWGHQDPGTKILHICVIGKGS